MPLYDFKCGNCGNEFEQVAKIAEKDSVTCPKCGSKCDTLITCSRVEVFKPFYHDDFGLEPVLVKSKGHYKELCKKHGVYAPHVFGQGWNISEI